MHLENILKKSDPRDLRPLRHLIRVMRRHDLTNKKTMTKKNTKTKTMTKTKFQLGPSLQQRNKDVRYVQIVGQTASRQNKLEFPNLVG